MQVRTCTADSTKYISLDDLLLVLYATSPMDGNTKHLIEQLLKIR